MTQQEIAQVVESIWTLFRETDRRLDQRFEETRQEIAALSAEMRATDQRLDQRFNRDRSAPRSTLRRDPAGDRHPCQ